MKKTISLLILFVFLIGFTFLIDVLPSNDTTLRVPKKTAEISEKSESETNTEEILKENFSKLRKSAEDAGYIVTDSFIDAKYEGVIDVFSVKINFNTYTVASIPVVLCESEDAVRYNCKISESGIKLPISNGCVFSLPGKDYPDNVLNIVKAIVNGEDVPKNTFAE